MRNNPKTFSLEYEDLDIGDTIGRGCSSVVLHAVHAPTGTPLALKVINMFDKSKRDQLIREICTLYDAECPGYSHVNSSRSELSECCQVDYFLWFILPRGIHHNCPGVHGWRIACKCNGSSRPDS
jgi:hypothetical protein